ncbi:hypothetical protein R3I94_007048 [Phoxinus phoxinus]
MASASESGDLTVLSWNINGLKDKLKKKERKTKLLEIFEQYDVVLLQETQIGEMKDPKDYNKNWEIITEALSKKYALVNLEDQTCIETADNQDETMEVLTKALSSVNLEDQTCRETADTQEEEEEEEEEEDDEEEEEEEKKKTMYMTNFSSRIKGVGILVNKPHTLLKGFSDGGYYAWVHVEIDQQKYTFASVYDHDVDDMMLLCLMLEITSERSDAFECRPVIGGDFNTTLDPELDATTDNPEHTAQRKTLKEILSIGDMSDVWREKHPGDRRYTHKSMSRLDYVFMLKDDVKYVESCEIHNDIVLSDHSPVSLTLNYTDSPQPTEE